MAVEGEIAVGRKSSGDRTDSSGLQPAEQLNPVPGSRLGRGRPEPELQDDLEVALHAGAAASVLVGQRRVNRPRSIQTFDSPKRRVMAHLFILR